MNSFEETLKTIATLGTGKVTEFQTEVQDAATEYKYAMSAQIFLQLVSTVAIVVMAWQAVQNGKK